MSAKTSVFLPKKYPPRKLSVKNFFEAKLSQSCHKKMLGKQMEPVELLESFERIR